MNIYVGNLSFNTTEDGLRDYFAAKGEVESAVVIKDRETGRSRGFGFVEMPSNDDGNDAISSLNGQELDGRALKINEARPKENSGGGGRY